jgi:HEAT repeat protein
MRYPSFFLAVCLLQVPGECLAQQPSKITARAEELVKQLQSPDSSVRGAAKLELQSSPSPVVLPILLEVLPTSSGDAQNALIDVLAVYKSPDKIPALVMIAAKSNNLSVAGQLEDLGAPAAKALMQSLGEPCEAEYASWVGETIGEMGDAGLPVLVEGFHSNSQCHESAAAEGLQRYYYRNCKDPGDRGPDPAAELFGYATTSADDRISTAAIQWINSQQIKEGTCVDFSGVVEPLIAAYQSNAPTETMVQIAKFLSWCPTARVTRFMRAAVHAPNPEIQGIAQDYLARNAAAEVPKPHGNKAPRTSAEKIAAAKKWGQSEDTSKTIPLADLLSDTDPKVRAAAAKGLGDLDQAQFSMRGEDTRETDQEHSIPPLIKALDDASPEVRAAAATAIGQILQDNSGRKEEGTNGDLTDRLLALLKDSDENVVAQGAWALGQIGDPKAISALAVLSEHKSIEIRGNAVEALGRMYDPKGTCPLVARLKDADEGVRYLAARGLFEKFKSGERCPGDVEALIAALGDPKEREWIQMTLGRLKDPRAVQPLIRDLAERGERNMYCHDCVALEEIGDKSAVEPLLPLLHDKNPVIAQGVVGTLAKLNDPRAVPSLIGLMKEPSMRILAINALVEMKQCQIMPEIRVGLTDEDPKMRATVADAVVKCKDVASIDLLIRMLGLDRPLAAKALGDLGDSRAVEPLIAILKQKDAKDRELAAHALGQLRDPRAVDALIAVVQQGKPQLTLDYLKWNAIWALGEIGDSRAVPLLQQIVASAPPVAQDQLADAATQALKTLGAPIPKREGKP